jgi:tetratricopeptide (TPR) repeat protein
MTKLEGDTLYNAKRYHEAIIKYTLAIDECTNPIAADIHLAYCNRAACYIQVGKFEKALDDAKSCTTLKPTWIQGWTRKGSCLASLGRTEDAIDAYEKALQIDESNLEAKKAVSKLRKNLGEAPRDTPAMESQQINSNENNRSSVWGLNSISARFLGFIQSLWSQILSFWGSRHPRKDIINAPTSTLQQGK